jgi:hypothetical protein
MAGSLGRLRAPLARRHPHTGQVRAVDGRVRALHRLGAVAVHAAWDMDRQSAPQPSVSELWWEPIREWVTPRIPLRDTGRQGIQSARGRPGDGLARCFRSFALAVSSCFGGFVPLEAV